MSMTKPKNNKKPAEIGVRSTTPIKFKDKPNRSAVRLNLLDTFGFVPEDIIVHKIRGKSNTMIISAVVLPDDKKTREKGKGVAESKKAAKKGV